MLCGRVGFFLDTNNQSDIMDIMDIMDINGGVYWRYTLAIVKI